MSVAVAAARPSRHAIVAAVLLAAGLSLGSGTILPAALGVEPSDSANRLEHPIVDLAALPEGGPDGAARLLTVDAFQTPAGVVHLSTLQRDRSWAVADETTVDVRSAELREPGDPWLIGLAPERFVLIVSSAISDRAVAVAFRTDGGPGGNAIEVLRHLNVDGAIDVAGASDVDGDGDLELVAASAHTERFGGTCQGSVVTVRDDRLAPLGTYPVPDIRLAGGVLGRFEDAPGDDLLVFGYPNCPAGPDTPGEQRLLLLRLADGSVTMDLPFGTPTARGAVPAPLRVDVDGDGRHEAIAPSGTELLALDPLSGWAATGLGGETVLPLLAIDGTPDRPARIGWLGSDGLGRLVATAALQRSTDGQLLVTDTEQVGAGALDPARLDLSVASVWSETLSGDPPTAWSGRLGASDCEVVMVPLAVSSCDGDGLRPGAAWVATRPILTVGDGSSQRLLVAGSLGWDATTANLPVTPSPWATNVAGWWRHGPSTSFALSELRSGDATYFREFPVPQATVERTANDDRTTNIPGFTGSRLFVRIRAMRPGDTDPGPAGSLFDALIAPVGPSEVVRVARIPVLPGLEAGRDGGFATVSLADARLVSDPTVERWAVTVVPINDWGEVGPPARGPVARDLIGPSLTLDVPGTTPIWPFAARLTGSSDPGTVVTVEGIGEMTLDRRGRFAFEAPLAPWPQTLRVTSVDGSGNVTQRELSVIGGIDYRKLPWPAIVAAGLIALVFVSGVIGSRRTRAGGRVFGPPVTLGAGATGRWSGRGSLGDDEPVAEIEDLEPGQGLPRG
ncbi:MAG TPA: hypothetical protein VD763_10650 [Candidatus Saccharimonadales bacterium]|nr:hypothetical protein [Candidatus Saccharimonadales bacterium]